MSIFRCGNARNALSVAAIWAACAGCAGAADIVFVGDFDNSQLIQWVRHHASAGGASIVLDPAFVTAVRTSGGGSFLTMYLEVPPALNGNTNYPQRSALKTFGDAAGGIPLIGDCVVVEGVIGKFNGATQLSSATWTPESSAACGDAPITPYVTSVATVASDTDPVAGLQPAPTAEPFESVLLKLSSPFILTSNGGVGAFHVGDDASGTGGYLTVAQFMYQYNAIAPKQVTSITGVFDEFDTMTDTVYQLLPRSASDIVE
jgi:predicted extracellular nuclease